MKIDWQKFRTDESYQNKMLFQNPKLCDRYDILGEAYRGIFDNDITLLGRIRNQNINMCAHAVAVNTHALSYIKIDLPDEFYIRVLKRSPESFSYIIDPSQKVCKYAVSYRGLNIRHVKNQTYEIQLRAIRTTPEAIIWCHRPSKKLRWLAITKNPNLITSIGGRSQSMVLSAVQDCINKDERSTIIEQIPKKFTRAHEYVKLLRA